MAENGTSPHLNDMKHTRPLAWRITLTLSGLIFLAVSLTAVLTFFVYRQMEEQMIDKLIQTESNRLVKRVSRFGNTWQQPFERDMGPSMFAWGESEAHPAPTLPAELRELPLGQHYLDKGITNWHVSIVPTMDGRLYVMYDSIVLEEQSWSFALALIGIVLACSLLGVFIGRKVAHWLVTPLNTLTDRLERWAPDGPPPKPGHANEADRLMDVFNRVQDQVDATIANQREFSANLHHEVRTPLTIIRSDAEILARLFPLHIEAAQSRLTRIVHAVEDIEQSLESTYQLTQAQIRPPETLLLHRCVQDILENLRLEAGAAGLTVLNEVSTQQEACLSRHALMTVIRNIVRNAVLHAAPATLTIRAVPDGLQFTDTGPGIDPAELPYIFERYFSRRRVDQRQADAHSAADALMDQKGLGLGLAIAQRVCVMQGWCLEVTSPVDGDTGTCFTLRFIT